MRRRKLHERLVATLGSNHVYFQPPESVKMEYPAIVYSLSSMESKHSNNHFYGAVLKFMVTYITRNPDDPVTEKILAMDRCRFDRYQSIDNLHHYYYTIEI